MSHLAQINLDRAAAARQGLHGFYEWHSLSWKLFPEKKKDDKRDFITRLDMLRMNSSLLFYRQINRKSRVGVHRRVGKKKKYRNRSSRRTAIFLRFLQTRQKRFLGATPKETRKKTEATMR